MKFIDNTWKVISEHERLQLTKTEGQVTGKFFKNHTLLKKLLSP